MFDTENAVRRQEKQVTCAILFKALILCLKAGIVTLKPYIRFMCKIHVAWYKSMTIKGFVIYALLALMHI